MHTELDLRRSPRNTLYLLRFLRNYHPWEVTREHLSRSPLKVTDSYWDVETREALHCIGSLGPELHSSPMQCSIWNQWWWLYITILIVSKINRKAARTRDGNKCGWRQKGVQQNHKVARIGSVQTQDGHNKLSTFAAGSPFLRKGRHRYEDSVRLL